MKFDKLNEIELVSQELDRIIVNQNNKQIKIVLEDGRRILVEYDKIEFIE